MVTFFDFPKEHWQHLRTSNPIESPFAALRLRTDAAKLFKKVDNATAVIWKMLRIGEKKFRRLKSPGLLEKVFQRDRFRRWNRSQDSAGGRRCLTAFTHLLTEAPLGLRFEPTWFH